MKKILLFLMIILSIGCTKEDIKKEKFEEETYYCRKSNGNYLYKAQVTSKENNLTYVYIEQNHNSVSNMPENLQNFIDETCDVLKYNYNDKQENYEYKCGDKVDIVKYNYKDNLDNTIKFLEEQEYECYTIEKEGNLVDILKNKTWCNYRRYRFAYTFDDFAVQTQGSIVNEREYSVSGNTVLIHENSYDITYTYNEETNTLNSNFLDDYLFECDEIEYNPSLVTMKYYYDNKEQTILPKSGFYKEDEYKFNKITCDNGVIGTYNEDRRMVFVDKNIKATCKVYFDKVT